MALHFDLQVNGVTIDSFAAVRRSGGAMPDSTNLYVWSITDHGEEFHGIIEHRFKDGAWTLVQSILGEVERQKQERIAYSLEA